MLKLDRYELAFEISPVPMLLVSQGGEIVLSNALFDQLFGYEPASLIGKNVDVLVPELIRGKHPDLRGAYFKVPAKRNMGQGRDLNGITKSGQIIPLELGLDTVTIEDQVYALVVALDIQQRKQHEQRMNLAMDAAASAMIMVNKDGNIVFVNKAALELFGYEESALLNTPIERLVPEDIQHVHPVYRGSFMGASKARLMAQELDLYALHRNGQKIPVEIALTPVETPDGKMVVSTIIDLSERVLAEQAMAVKNEELKLLNDDLMQFAYSASHDLKAPISTMVGLLDLCISDWDAGDVDEARLNITKVSKIGRRCVDKIETVLKIALAGHSQIPPQQVDLESILQDIWLDLAGSNDDDIQLRSALHHEPPILLEIDTLKVILENLLSNAIRYCDREKAVKTIDVTSSSKDENLTILVADNGIGIPKEGHDVIFQMFKRIDERSENGLGLVLVKKQINRLGGTIDFTSTLGEGTVFTITLPLPPMH